MTVQYVQLKIISYFAEAWSNVSDASGAFLIDRSPVYFEPIINYLRHGQLILDKGVNPQGSVIMSFIVYTGPHLNQL